MYTYVLALGYMIGIFNFTALEARIKRDNGKYERRP